MNAAAIKQAFNQVLTQPEAIPKETYDQLVSLYPYARVLHNSATAYTDTPESLSLKGLYKHPLWTAPVIIEVMTEEGEEPSKLATQEVIIVEALEQPEVELDLKQDIEDVSVYHDEHLPYSFLWWLNKTRMEYAHTYRPYAPLKKQASMVENHLLDQQIRENIFHLQDPEDKLSEATLNKSLAFEVPKQSHSVIDRFIEEEPKISPPRPDKLTSENKARQSASDRNTVVTETLAGIYTEQGLYTKAIEVYEKLSLKYPEKSAYFADRIDELKNKLI